MATLQHWAGRGHEHKGTRRVFDKHWRRSPTGRPALATPDGLHRMHRADMLIRPHVRVRGTASSYDGDPRYQTQRLCDHRPLATDRIATLLERQQGICLSYGWRLRDRDTIKVDHVIPPLWAGAHYLANMKTLDRHGHDKQSAHGRSLTHGRKWGIHDQDHVDEEPDEVNASRPVLKSSRSSEGTASLNTASFSLGLVGR